MKGRTRPTGRAVATAEGSGGPSGDRARDRIPGSGHFQGTVLQALVIGIDIYADPRVRDLSGARNDATDLLTYLTDELGPHAETVALLDAQATRSAIEGAFEGLDARVAPGDDVLVYFACHGCAKRVSPFVPATAYLATHDTDPERVEATSIEVHLGLPGAIAPLMDRTMSIVMVIDACFTPAGRADTRAFVVDGSLRLDGVLDIEQAPRSWQEIGMERGGTALVAATRVSHPAFEDVAAARGMFTRRFLQSVRDEATAGPVRLSTALARTADVVRVDTDGRQHPMLSSWEASPTLRFPSRHDLRDR